MWLSPDSSVNSLWTWNDLHVQKTWCRTTHAVLTDVNMDATHVSMRVNSEAVVQPELKLSDMLVSSSFYIRSSPFSPAPVQNCTFGMGVTYWKRHKLKYRSHQVSIETIKHRQYLFSAVHRQSSRTQQIKRTKPQQVDFCSVAEEMWSCSTIKTARGWFNYY